MLKAPDYLGVPTDTANSTRLAVLCCLFHVNQNPLVINNYWRFAKEIRNLGLPLYTIECTLPGDVFAIPQDDTVLRCQALTVGWHKERLLNMLARRVPPRFTKLAWIDADVILHCAEWAYETERLLDHYHVVQPFSAARWLDRDGRTLPEVKSPDTRCCDGAIAHAAHHEIGLDLFDHTHPGFAWAMRRDTWLRLGGLCDRVLNMAADSVMVGSFLGVHEQPQVRQHYERIPTVRDWFFRASDIVRRSVTYVPGMIDHMWHGYWLNRQYVSLGNTIFSLNIDFDAAVVDDPADPENTPRIVKDTALLAIYRRYFKIRNSLRAPLS